jgi:hypothetical protein
MNKVYFILFLTCVMELIACSKSTPYKTTPPPPDIHIIFAKADLDYVQLPVNRYFIYKDSATGNTDSVIVTQSDMSDPYEPPHPSLSLPGVYYQEFNLALTKVNSGTTWFQGSANSRNGAYGPYSADSMARVRFNPANDNIVTDATIYVSYYGFCYTNDSTFTYYPSFEVGTHIYNDVIINTVTNIYNGIGSQGYFKSTYCWAKGIGIVKRTVQTDSAITTSLLERYGN